MEWLKCPPYGELVELAIKNNIQYADRDKWELFADLAAKGEKSHPAFQNIGVFKREYSPSVIEERKSLNQAIPGSVIYPKSMEKDVLNFIGEHKNAFGSYIFRNPDSLIHYTFTNDVTCACGEKFVMERMYKENGIPKREKVEEKFCTNPDCRGGDMPRKWIRLDREPSYAESNGIREGANGNGAENKKLKKE
jgi:hypothetical protein